MEKDVSIPITHQKALKGMLTMPDHAKGLIIFAHGSGSSRFSPRNQRVAHTLQTHGFATLLLDLLCPDEEENESLRFSIPLLADRLVQVIGWVKGQKGDLCHLPVGLFGASTGAAAALMTAATPPLPTIQAVVCRGGRTDLVKDELLARVACPTLLIVGERDPFIVSINEKTRRALTCKVDLKVVPYATHLFEEEGCLEKVAEFTSSWFETHLKKS